MVPYISSALTLNGYISPADGPDFDPEMYLKKTLIESNIRTLMEKDAKFTSGMLCAEDGHRILGENADLLIVVVMSRPGRELMKDSTFADLTHLWLPTRW